MGGLITALVIASIAVLATAFWDEIHQWIKGLLKKIENKLCATAQVLIKKIGETYIEIVKIWVKNGNKIEMTLPETREVSESEVPDYIKEKLKKMENKEMDITEDYERELVN